MQGELRFGWRFDLVTLIESRNDFQFIHFNVIMQNNRSWFLSVVYASPADELHVELWGNLATMAASI